MKMKKNRKKDLYKEAFGLYYNKGLSIEKLAKYYGKSVRTIYRWLKNAKQGKDFSNDKNDRKKGRSREYPLKLYNRVYHLKKEVPERSAPMIHRIIKEEFPLNCPSISTIRKYIKQQGLSSTARERKRGYIKFARERPNELWQIDIAGVQSVGHLKKLFLIGILDDCSRFIVGAQYFKTQKKENVLKVIRDAIIEYGRPKQIISDHGAQFRNLRGELGTKYSQLLYYLDVEPIFARPHHPETKGKIERWFGTVRQMFLVEARHKVKKEPTCTLTEFNQMFKKWVHWYNTEKRHYGLHEMGAPAQIYFNTKDRVFRPLQTEVSWKKWLYEVETRKVSKYNEISYKSQKFKVPPGYTKMRVDVVEYEDSLELYYKDKRLISHPYKVPVQKKRKTRKITHNGTVRYRGSYYTIDYKLAGKTVEVQEVNNGQGLLVYLDGVLLKKLTL
jgi:transposase InsO family protein